MLALKAWVQKELCEGHSFKIPTNRGDMTQFTRGEPQVFCAWPPMYPDRSGHFNQGALNVVPSIVIMPNFGYLRYQEDQPFDRTAGIRRPQDLGQGFNVQMLFSVYEPGVRMEGFYASTQDPEGYDMTKLIEGTEEGLFTLTDWMDDAVEKLLGLEIIPGTDLRIDTQTSTYSLYTDESYVVDKRPIYYGFLNLGFKGYANEKPNRTIEDLLS